MNTQSAHQNGLGSSEGNQTHPCRRASKWMALVNDENVYAPARHVSARIIMEQAGIPLDHLLIRDHGSDRDVPFNENDMLDLAEGNVFSTMRSCEYQARGECPSPAKLAWFIDDHPEITLRNEQTGRTLRGLFGLTPAVRLFRDGETSQDERIDLDTVLRFAEGPVFYSRRADTGLMITVNKQTFYPADGVKPEMTGREIANLITSQPCEVKRVMGGKEVVIGLDEKVRILGCEEFTVIRCNVVGGYEPSRIERELKLLRENGAVVDFVTAPVPLVIYRRVPTRAGYPHIAESDVLVLVPNAYPGVMLDGAYLPQDSPLLGRVAGQRSQGSINAEGKSWELVSYHPHNGGGGPAWNPNQHGIAHLLFGDTRMDSTRQRLTHPIQMAANSNRLLIRSTAQQRQQLDRILYRRYPDAEWGTFFRYGYRVTRWGVLACIVDLIPPKPGDLNERSPLVEFSPGYIGRALRTFDSCELGIGVIHSHPEGCKPSPSPADDDMDSYFAEEFEKFSGGRPYVSLIASRDQFGRRSFSGRCFTSGNWIRTSEWLTCGKEILHRDLDFRAVPLGGTEQATTERISQLLGETSIQRLRNASVGVVGASGLGSPAVHVLARAGVGRFVLVDNGVFKVSNHERNHASRATDLTNTCLKKVELLQRLISEIRPETHVTAIPADVLTDHAIDELTCCDLILGCTDSFYARAALGDIATHYSVPVIDLAVQMGSHNGVLTEQVGEIARYMPGLPCPWCRKRVTAADIRAELATEEERILSREAVAAARGRGEDGANYWIGERRQELAVGYMTTALAAMGAGYAENWLTGTGSMPHDRFQFDLGLRSLGVVSDTLDPDPNCSCVRYIGFADQGRAAFTVSLPKERAAPLAA